MHTAASEVPQTKAVIPVQNKNTSLHHVDDASRLLLNDSWFELNPTGRLVWSLCKGSFRIDEIADLVAEAFPDSGENSSTQVASLIDKLAEHGLLQLHTSSEFQSAAPWNAQTTFVNYHRPTPEMLWHLEAIRQFVSGLYQPFESVRAESREEKSIEDMLSTDELLLAKMQDANTSRGIGMDEHEHYRHIAQSPSFESHQKAIMDEFKTLIPEIEENVYASGHAYYHTKGYMGWHSNHAIPGRRVYCTWTAKEKTNFFRYEDPVTGDIVTHWEPAGWTVKSFHIPESPYRLWHCIQADSHRFALGFRATKEKTSRQP